MADTLTNIKLDKENVEFNAATDFVRHTDRLVYLTGKAGTGKTTFLKYIKDNTNKNTVVLAPTGVAAINAGGVTIHSFFQIPFGPFVPGDTRLRTSAKGEGDSETIYSTFKFNETKKSIIENMELLIIDEVSMVRVDTLDVIDRILKIFRNKPNLPFGGVQVILIGDTFQLPPIADREQWSILSQFYTSQFFFSSRVIEQYTPVYIELKKIYRQSEQEFIDLLNRVRVSQVNENDLKLLNAKYDPAFSGNGNDYIILATHNKIVNETNFAKLNQLTTESYTYEADVEGIFPDGNKPTGHNLKLKVGAQIMFVKNDAEKKKRYFNGKIGKIKELDDDTITVEFDDETEVEVERAVWENIQYSYDKKNKKIKEEIVGTFEQFPIRLAWAITVHKSQGLTFEKVIADLGNAFSPGQVYVALSRCTSFSGLKLKTQIGRQAIKTDPRVIEFARNETPDTLITDHLNTGKADFYYKKAREDFYKGKIESGFDFFKKALKFRDDIDTDQFEKFIKVKGKRLLDYKQKCLALIQQSDIASIELKEAEKTNSLMAQELNMKNAQISEYDSKLHRLLEDTSQFESDIKQLKKVLKESERKLYISQKKSIAIEAKLQKTERKLFNKRWEVKAHLSEIERLNGLKWYRKLLGRK